MKRPERLHLVDGTFELYRAHYSKRPAKADADGRDVKATFGVVSSLRALMRDPEERVTHMAVAFDNPIRSFRNDLFEGYKSDEGVPPELRAQFDAVEAAVRALGITVWSMNTFEADDALAAGAVKFAAQFDEIRILSPDKDLLQVLAQNNVCLVDRIRKREVRNADVQALRGVKPQQIPDLLALTGDAADGIPGLRGFGPKTAAALLSQFETIEDVTRPWPFEVRGKQALEDAFDRDRDQVLLWKQLTTLRTDVPLAQTCDELRVPELRDS
jgi:5'-3' exonuclease